MEINNKNIGLKRIIKARDFLDIVYCMSAECCKYHGLEEDESNELTYNMFTEYLEHKASKDECFMLFEG